MPRPKALPSSFMAGCSPPGWRPVPPTLRGTPRRTSAGIIEAISSEARWAPTVFASSESGSRRMTSFHSRCTPAQSGVAEFR